MLIKMELNELLRCKETKSSVTHLKYSLKAQLTKQKMKFWDEHWEPLYEYRGKGAGDRNEWEVLLQLQKSEKGHLTSYYWNERELTLKIAKKI